MTLKKPLRILLGAGLLLGVLAAGAYLQDPLFWRRLLTFPAADAVAAVDWYQPLEAVSGAERNDLPTAAPDEISVSRKALAAARAYAVETGSIALLIWHRGALQLEHYGAGYDHGTRTESGALHQTVLGLLYGAAVADGIVGGLDQPAARYLPEWRDDARQRIRVGHLLGMSSGLEVLSPGSNPWGKWWRLRLGSDIELVALSVPAVTNPGSRFEYSHVNSQLLGIALQRASGRRYARYLSARLWEPLGAGTAFVWLDEVGGMARTYCCLQTTARGWLRVGLLLMNRGRVGGEQIVPEAWVAQMMTPQSAQSRYGLHLWLGGSASGERRYNSQSDVSAMQSEPFLASDVIFLDGHGGQRVFVVPSHELVIVRTGAARSDWDDARLPNAVLRGLAVARVDGASHSHR